MTHSFWEGRICLFLRVPNPVELAVLIPQEIWQHLHDPNSLQNVPGKSYPSFLIYGETEEESLYFNQTASESTTATYYAGLLHKTSIFPHKVS